MLFDVFFKSPPCNPLSAGVEYETLLLSTSARTACMTEHPAPVNTKKASRQTFTPRNVNCTRQRSSGNPVALWAAKLAWNKRMRCSLRDAHGSDHHKTLQLYTVVAVNAPKPGQTGFPAT